jgi:hypothetical protein
MNSIFTTRLTHTVMIAAALAALFMSASAQAAPADSSQVVTLPRVVVTGKRAPAAPAAQVVQLPRVVVTGRRADSRDTQQARRDEMRAPAVVLIARR